MNTSTWAQVAIAEYCDVLVGTGHMTADERSVARLATTPYIDAPTITAGQTVASYRAQRPHRPRRHSLLLGRRGRKGAL
jgi:hypothetical protein